ETLIDRSGAAASVYIATAEAGDVEMATRIAAHRARRDGKWLTVEAPLELADAIMANAAPARPILVDCLTLWLSNLMHAGHDCDDAFDQLVDAFDGLACPIMLVSNEVGLGIVPDNK